MSLPLTTDHLSTPTPRTGTDSVPRPRKVTPLTVVRDIQSAPSVRARRAAEEAAAKKKATDAATSATTSTDAVTTLTEAEFLARREALLAADPDQSTHCPTPTKTAYASTSAAARHLFNAWRKGRAGMTLPTRFYACHCGYWHLTSHPVDEIPAHHRIVVIADDVDTSELAEVIDLDVYAQSVTPIAKARAISRDKAWQRRRDGGRRLRAYS